MNRSINLFCLPFAGGNKYSYREYLEKAPGLLNIIPLDYPGRGSRIKEPLQSDINALVEDLYTQVQAKTEEGPYAIYGHSMGGLLTYLLAKKLVINKKRKPIHLIITGTSGPSDTRRSEKQRHLMPSKEFIQEIKDFGGMPDEVLQNDELLYYFEPILRSDFRTSENYVYQQTDPLDVPITIITGTEEDMTQPEIALWQKESTKEVEFMKMKGNHFFIYQHTQEIINIICKKLYIQPKVYQI